MAEQVIKVPYSPLAVQAQVHRNLKRLSVVVLHRGAGKTILAINELIRAAFTCPDTSGAQFIYIAPEKQQAKNIVWEKLKYYTQHIPDLRIREDELTIRFPDNNAVICLEGADNPDRLRGRHPHFVVMDEVGQMKRDVWFEVVMPGTMAHQAPVLFIGTPKGDNLFKELYEQAKELMEAGNPDWYACLENVYTSGRFQPSEIEFIKRTQPKAKFEQEYLCSFDASFTGSYYSEQLFNNDSRLIGDYAYNPMYPVITGWDLGTVDRTAIWFAQQYNDKIYLIDYYENSEKDIYHYINMIKNKPYVYDYHILPHDASRRSELDLTKSREGVLKMAGLKTYKCPKINPQEGIVVVQSALYKCRFDRERCRVGIRNLSTYRAKTDKVTGEPTEQAVHCDTSDAFRYLIMGMKKPNTRTRTDPTLWFLEEERDKNVYDTYDVFGL